MQYSLMPYTEIVRTYHADGQLQEEKFYRDGKLDGEFKTWHDNGQLYEYGFYQNGEKVGRFRIRDRNGKRWIDAVYRDKKEECMVWYENGHPYLKATYASGYELNGERQSWYENGGIHTHQFYQNGDLIDDKFTSTKKRSFLRIIKYFRNI